MFSPHMMMALPSLHVTIVIRSGKFELLVVILGSKTVIFIYFFLSSYAKQTLRNMSRYKPDTRTAFSRQPAHYLLFDVGHPMTSTQMRNTIMVFSTCFDIGLVIVLYKHVFIEL
jgi:hypothetical protein